jgi:hypothetical protein
MRLKNLVIISILLLGIYVTSCKPNDNKLSELETQEGWKLLFDGKEFNGWRDYQGVGVKGPWKVEKGLLVAEGKGSDSTGYLISEDQFENFILTFDWKTSELGNSGVFYHVVERPKYKVPYITGPEYQVLDEVGSLKKKTLQEWQLAGADYAMYPADKSKKKLNETGEWNSSKIVFDNGHVEHWLNNEKIVEFEAWTDDWFARKTGGKNAAAPEYGLSRSGNLALQDHGSTTWYKNIKIKELPRKPREEVLFNGKDLTGWEIVGTELWYVENGLLVCESGPNKKYGYLQTRKYYNDFDLTLDFKQIADGNSGVFIRSYIKGGTDISGWQVEVAPLGNHSGGIYESESGGGGRGWISVQLTPEKENALKDGEWNTMRIRAIGDEVTTWLNGMKITELKDEKVGRGKGRIMLQIHDVSKGNGIKVLWKNMQIKELNR